MKFRQFCDSLLPLTVATALLGVNGEAIAALYPSVYLPNDKFCAVYQGNVSAQKAFTLWADPNRQLTIKADRELKVAVLQSGKLIPPFAIDRPDDPSQLAQSYRTVSEGNHQIVLRGTVLATKISICLR